MKKKRPTPGPGDRAISNLVKHIATYAGGSCSEEPGGLWLSFDSGSSSAFIAYEPTDGESWATRLKWVEKQSAIFLLNAPVLYGLKGRRKGGSKQLRLSFGLSLSLGPAIRKRYTAVVRQGHKGAAISEDGHLPVPRHGHAFRVPTLPKWAHSCLPALATGIAKTCAEYRMRPEVESVRRLLVESRRQELSDLNNFYRRKSGTNDRLLGLPEPGTEGSASIEAELRRLQNVVLQRYTVHVNIRVLSLGLIENV